MNRDLSKNVILRLARDIGEAPYEESISDLASTILVEGDNNLLSCMDNPAAPTPWGKWESYASQGGVSDKDTAQAFMASTLPMRPEFAASTRATSSSARWTHCRSSTTSAGD